MDKEGRNEDWHRDLVEKLATDALKERKRSRRWGIFFKLLTFAYLFAVFILLIPEDWSDNGIGKKEAHTAVVDLEGLIAAGEKASADNVITGLRDAFEDEKTKAVILRINSPGGSPVQSSYMYKEILRLREKYPDTALYAVVSDICASGGYYVASAADRDLCRRIQRDRFHRRPDQWIRICRCHERIWCRAATDDRWKTQGHPGSLQSNDRI